MFYCATDGPINVTSFKKGFIKITISISDLEPGLTDTIVELKTLAGQNDVPYFFVLGRHKLGKACRRKVGVSAVGIFNYQGSETNFHRMQEIVKECKVSYDVMLQKAFVDVGGTVAVDVGGGVTSQVTQTKEEPIKDEADSDIAGKLLDILRKS